MFERRGLGISIAVWVVACAGQEGAGGEVGEACVPAAQADLAWVPSWSAAFGGVLGQDTNGIVVRDGMVDVTGHFAGVADFDPGEEVVEREASLPPEHDAGTYVSRFMSEGEYLWTAVFRGTRPVDGDVQGLARLDDGSLIVSGAFSRLADFDPGPGGDFHEPAGMFAGGYITRLRPDGSAAWTRTEGYGGAPIARVLSDGRIVAAGPRPEGYTLAIDILDPETGALVQAGPDLAPPHDFDVRNDDVIVAMVDTASTLPGIVAMTLDGDVLWERTIGYADVYDLAITEDDGVIVVGDSTGVLEGFEFTSVGHRDAFAMRFARDGEREWVATWGGEGHDRAISVVGGPDGTAFVAGSFYGTLVHGGSSSELEARRQDAYVVQIDRSGTIVGARVWGGDGEDEARALAFDGALWVAGTFEGTMDASAEGTHVHASQGVRDALLLRLEPGVEAAGGACPRDDGCDPRRTSSRLAGTSLPQHYEDCVARGFGTYHAYDASSTCRYAVSESSDPTAFDECRAAGGGDIELEPGRACDIVYSDCTGPCFGNLCD